MNRKHKDDADPARSAGNRVRRTAVAGLLALVATGAAVGGYNKGVNSVPRPALGVEYGRDRQVEALNKSAEEAAARISSLLLQDVETDPENVGVQNMSDGSVTLTRQIETGSDLEGATKGMYIITITLGRNSKGKLDPNLATNASVRTVVWGQKDPANTSDVFERTISRVGNGWTMHTDAGLDLFTGAPAGVQVDGGLNFGPVTTGIVQDLADQAVDVAEQGAAGVPVSLSQTGA